VRASNISSLKFQVLSTTSWPCWIQFSELPRFPVVGALAATFPVAVSTETSDSFIFCSISTKTRNPSGEYQMPSSFPARSIGGNFKEPFVGSMR